MELVLLVALVLVQAGICSMLLECTVIRSLYTCIILHDAIGAI